MNAIKLFKIRTGLVYANEDVINKIIMYCLGQMTNSELDFTGWEISVRAIAYDNADEKYFECQNYNEAKQTKDFFLDYKTMFNREDDDSNGNFLKVKKHFQE
ncbi:MAG: hypothetical protein WCP69_03270 [Bacteroidota bacterium]